MNPASDNRPAPTSRIGRLVRTLRNLTALGLLTLSVGVLALWVRSYEWCDGIQINSGRTTFSVASLSGRSYFGRRSNSGQMLRTRGRYPRRFLIHSRRSETMVDSLRKSDAKFSQRRAPNAYGFGSHRTTRYSELFAPHWFVALVFALLAFALKPKPRLKFSLADLLVVMTFSAVLIAGVAGLTRLAS
jgi:hypothetical protein